MVTEDGNVSETRTRERALFPSHSPCRERAVLNPRSPRTSRPRPSRVSLVSLSVSAVAPRRYVIAGTRCGTSFHPVGRALYVAPRLRWGVRGPGTGTRVGSDTISDSRFSPAAKWLLARSSLEPLLECARDATEG